MTRGERRSSIAGPAGTLEVAFNVPEGAVRGIALIAHPHPLQGGTLDNKVVQTLAKTFAALGYAATRFNFRGVGLSEGRFDDGIGETDDALAALAAAKLEFGELPVALAGFSFGSYVQTRVAHAIA
ncbi:MAG TPA: alpha/beta hydrolase, partial [Casimicrobiaceae bacterium]|nr:alpha/beta hydrolase [Casimicrobiaceae bacterium]